MKAHHVALAVVTLAIGSDRALGEERGAAEDHHVVLEIAAAGEWGLGDSSKTSYGPSFALAVTPIEHQLEIEFGLAPMFDHGSAEWEGEIVFKKPFELSKHLELLVGVGPTISSSSFGAVGKLDLVYWKTPQFGWFLEPSYGYAFNRDHEQNVTLKVGLLFALPTR